MTPTFKARQTAPSRKDRKAFTLIELLVVIAIISLLVSILLPSLQKAKDLARAVACSANLRGLTMALLLYANDNNQLIPPYSVGEGTSDYRFGGSQWYMKMEYTGYIEDDKTVTKGGTTYYLVDPISQCPGWAPETDTENTFKGFRYGMRVFWRWKVAGMYKYPDEVPGGQYDFHDLDRIKSMATFFIFNDTVSATEGSLRYGQQSSSMYWNQTTPYLHTAAHGRHVGNVNTSFLDGHVEAKLPEYFSRIDQDPEQNGYTTNGSGTTRSYTGVDLDMNWVP